MLACIHWSSGCYSEWKIKPELYERAERAEQELKEMETKIRKGIHLVWQSFKILQLRSVFLALGMQTGGDTFTHNGIMTHHSFLNT